ncbi:MAG: transcriptional regulator [Spirochaetales bacterium]|uniref:Transcriptional regulator n=1 Tax=Candidatus Thalassospirochaeta sargassi TaxID=3119039 RepID=A0AAJ1MKG0_9SPIO|nr:transcriptional regulator [Spirochaetales bacterium]
MNKSDENGGRFAYEGLDRLMHEKARLSIMASLYTRVEGHNFNELKKLCSLTDGNLSRHITVLKQAGLIEVIKGYEGNKPNTVCRLTESGRERFKSYLTELEQVIRDAAAGSIVETVDEKRGFSPA